MQKCLSVIVFFLLVALLPLSAIAIPALSRLFSKLKVVGRLSPAILILLITFLPAAAIAIPAFPGAEGYGAGATGGRGGVVYHVTNLNEDGVGSLEFGLRLEMPRTIVFDTGGVIEAYDDIKMNADQGYNDIDLTIAGQTAPGGITISGAPFGTGYANDPNVTFNNMIWRFIRCRGVHNTANGETEGTDPISLYRAINTILDHISVSWGCDETIDALHSRDISFQYSIVAEPCKGTGNWCGPYNGGSGHPEGDHNLGYITGYSISTYHSFSHMIWAHSDGRNPLVKGNDTIMVTDIRNAINYNNGAAITLNGGTTHANITGVLYRPGINSGSKGLMGYVPGDHKLYIDDCIYEGREDNDPWTATGEPNRWFYHIDECTKLNSPITVHDEYPITTHPLMEGYDIMLAKSGCFPRDSTDRRIIRDIQNGTGSYFKYDDPPPAHYTDEQKAEYNREINTTELMGVSSPPDTDGDGMPDMWEDANGFDKNTADNNGDHDGDGYTNLEEYINDLAKILLDEQTANPTGGVEQIYHPDYDPSKIELAVTVLQPSIKISAYPNPCSFNGVLKIFMKNSSSFSEKTKVFVYDVTGKKVAQLKASSETVWNGRDISGRKAAPGIYIIQVKNRGKTLASEKIALVN